MKTAKKLLCVIISALSVISLVSVSALADSGFIKSEYTQTHTVSSYKTRNASYQLIYGKAIGEPLDGTDGNIDLCIPGLSDDEGMVPQGITYWEDEDIIIISSHGSKDEQGSVLFLLSAKTGELLRQYSIYYSSTGVSKAHLGGIAASKYNLYMTYGNSRVAYIPLNDLKSDSNAVIIASEKKTVNELNGANVSYMSFGDGCLWLGNYYDGQLEQYDTKVTEDNPSAVFGYKLTGDSSSAEWSNLNSAAPTYSITIPKDIIKLQGAAVSSGKLYLNCSRGRSLDSKLYVCPIDMTKAQIALSESEIISFTTLPMAEGLYVYDGYIYTINESAAFSAASNPTDVVWKTSVKALVKEKTSLTDIFSKISSFFDNFSGRLKSVFSK